MAAFLDLYEPLDVIGNGSFGIIRKVRRKADGVVFARKELNFERMSEHDRKQIVAEVNILKDLHHENIVRYHDRYVDRDAGILYIIMEYCGGGDLSGVIKQAQKHSRLIPEDAIWNYFMQILLALHHCHHPNGHGRSGSSGGGAGVLTFDGKERRPQILHRDLKPDNVFLDNANRVKLGDFGLSKALAQASFANTYVGTPYYMSPELMQEKAYDSKSDIWSLGCLIYELCALKPPFHEAKTHAELSIFIRNGRIPPLPRGYSQPLYAVIKSMLNLNPAMRPSAAQLLQHERLELVFKISETEKMISTVKTHKTTVAAKERDILAREATLAEKESHVATIIAQKDAEIRSLQSVISQLQEQLQSRSDITAVDLRVREAISKREEELRVAVMKREEEVAIAMARREEEIMRAIRLREEEIAEAWRAREEQIRNDITAALQERENWLAQRADELRLKEESLDAVHEEVEAKIKALEQSGGKREKREKNPLEEVHNILARMPVPSWHENRIPSTPAPASYAATFATPVNRDLNPPSAMKGIILTSTGESLATPTPGELAKLFVASPKVGLDFSKIFDFDEDGETEHSPTSPTLREKTRPANPDDASQPESSAPTAPPTRLRRPSIVRLRPSASKATISDSGTQGPSSAGPTRSNSQSNPSLPTTASKTNSVPPPSSKPPAEYDFNDEENLPSPFLKKAERMEIPSSSSGGQTTKPVKRISNGNLLRAVAAANAANVNGGGTGKKQQASDSNQSTGGTCAGARPLLVSARKATEEARRVLLRP